MSTDEKATQLQHDHAAEEALVLAASDSDANVRQAAEGAWLALLTSMLGEPVPRPEPKIDKASLDASLVVRLGPVWSFLGVVFGVGWTPIWSFVLVCLMALSERLALAVSIAYFLAMGMRYLISWLLDGGRENNQGLDKSWVYGLREAARDKGTKAYEARDYRTALEEFRWLATGYPDDANAWYLLGLTLDEVGDPDKALTCYNRVLALAPRHGNAWNNKGSVLHRTKAYSAAFKCFQEAWSLGSKEAENNIKLMVNAGQIDSRGAVAILEKITRNSP